MRKFTKSLLQALCSSSSFLLAGALPVGAETNPPTPVVRITPYQVDEDFVVNRDPALCDFFNICPKISRIRTLYLSSDGNHSQYRTVYKVNGEICTKSISWTAANVKLDPRTGNPTSAIGTTTERCGSGTTTRGTTTELPTTIHRQALGSETQVDGINWDGENLIGDFKLTYLTNSFLGPKFYDTPTYYTQRVRYAFGAQRSVILGSTDLPAGTTCDKFSVGSAKLTALRNLGAADASFMTQMKTTFNNKVIFCETIRRLWQADATQLTPKPVAGFATQNIIQYRISLDSQLIEK